MKKAKKITCIVAVVIMLLSTTGVGVFAEEPEVLGVAGETAATVSDLQIGNAIKTSSTKCSINISWQGDAASYIVKENGNKKGTTTNRSFKVSGLLQNCICDLEVIPCDSEGVEGEPASISVMTVIMNASSGNTQAALSWGSVEGEGTYIVEVYHGDSEGQNLAKEGELTVNGTSVIVGAGTYGQALTNKDLYRFVLKTTDGICSPMSKDVYPDAAPDPVENLKAYSSYENVLLEWDKIDDEDVGYIVKRASTEGGTYKLISGIIPSTSVSKDDPNTIQFRDKNVGNGKSRAKYYYEVYSVRGFDVETCKPANVAAKTSGECVHNFIIAMKLVATKTYKATDGVSMKISSSTQLYSSGYGAGKYQVYYEGHLFYIPRLAGKSQKADWFSNGYNYSEKEATDFVNQRGNTSKTKYLVWASHACQHVYVFTGSKGNWKLTKDWECATGKATAPTPTGTHEIWKKIRTRHGLPYWSPFASYNSLHGKLSSWPVGHPDSVGCIRNANANAQWVYSNCGIGTTVISW